MRMVRVTITYGMDDEGKSLVDERRDWLDGAVTVQDIVDVYDEQAVVIEELRSA